LLRSLIRSKLQNRYGLSDELTALNQYSEQLAYGHREIIVEYLALPKEAYFSAVLTHGKILPHIIDPIFKLIGRDEKPLLQILWRSDAEREAELNGIRNVKSIGATGLYALSNIGHGIDKSISNIENFAYNYFWGKSTEELLNYFQDKKILVMPFHSWDGDVIEHDTQKIEFLKALDPTNVRICLGYLDFCDPKVRRLYSQFGWETLCAGVRASKAFASPAGGRVGFLYELFKIFDWADIIVGDELTTGMFYSVCMGKKIGLFPGDFSIKLKYSKWQTDEQSMRTQNRVRELYPWLIGVGVEPSKIFDDICSALGTNKFKAPNDLIDILPWYKESKLL
jgi:hypothetical protein